jgi:uncharacterized protein (DUF302 family)
MRIYHSATQKPIDRFVEDLALAANARGFLIHNEDKMALAHTFGQHGAAVADGFDLHMIQVCKPHRAAKSLSKNPERSVLMPKFIMTFTQNEMTQIRFLYYQQATVMSLIDDAEFPGSLATSFEEIIALIEEAA